MNRKQIRSIECLTSQMLDNAPHHTRANVIFRIEALGSGFAVHCFNCPYQSRWTDMDFQAFAVIGPRGGVRGYRVLSK